MATGSTEPTAVGDFGRAANDALLIYRDLHALLHGAHLMVKEIAGEIDADGLYGMLHMAVSGQWTCKSFLNRTPPT